MNTAGWLYTSNPCTCDFYVRIAYRVFRRQVDFVDATALSIVGPGGTSSGGGTSGPGATLTSFTRTTSAAVFNTVCTATGSATAYHNGSGTYPVDGDNIYTSNTGNMAFLTGGYYKLANNTWIRITGNQGEVTASGSC